jgi:multiple sugar transport system substrate-binding protein
MTAMVLLASTGCLNTHESRVTLRFWNGFTGPDGRTMLRLVQRFNRENPDVDVLMQRMDWATYYNKLFVAGIGDRAPEVFVLQTLAMLRFSRAKFVRPVDDLMEGPGGLNSDLIPANIWNSVETGNTHFGLPLDIWTLGMYYNKKLFRDAGIVDSAGQARPPTNQAEFLAAAQKLTRHGPNGDEWGFVFTNFESNAYTIMRQFGGAFFTPDYSRCVLDNPQNVEALQFCVDLIRKYKVAPPPENFDAWIGFRQGRVGMAFEGIYMLADLQKQKDLDFGGAPVPTIGPHPAVWTGSHNLCLRSDLKGKQLSAAWRFVKFLSDHSVDWAAGGQIPARTDIRNTDRFHAMPVQSAFAREIPIVNYLPRLSFIFEFQTEFNNAVEKALRGTATPQAALAEATANINKVIARERSES